MKIGTGHWVFAGLFALGFVIMLLWAYKDDIKRTPWLFKGSGMFFLVVFLSIMILIVLKILWRAGYLKG